MLCRFVGLSLGLFIAVGTATARAADCGTIVVPPGIGVGPGADITSFNPLLVDSLYNQEAAYLLFAQLLWIAPDHSIDYSRSIATAVTTPDQGKTYNIALRSWHWSDGVPVTAGDVAYSLALIRQLGSTYPGYEGGGMPDIIAALTVTDARHFTITLKHQVNPDWFILNGLAQLVTLPEHVWSRYTLDEIWQNQSTPAFFAVDDGPLKIKKLAIGLDAEFIPNPAFEGAPVHFARFIMKFMDSEGAELQGAESGELDISNLPFALWDAAQHLPHLHIVTLPPSYSYSEFIPNMNNRTAAFFADVRVRQAMQDAINQPQMINLAMHGHGDPVYNGVPPEPVSFLSPAAAAGRYPVGYDPQKASALLAQAGFTRGPDGILQRGGIALSFTILIPAGQDMRIEMAESIQQNLQKIGIDVKIHQVEFNQLLALLVGPADGWQGILMATQLSPYPSGEAAFVSGAFYDNNNYSDTTMNKLVMDSTEKPGLAGLFAYQNYAAAQQPVIFLPVEKYSVLVRNGLHGVQKFLSPVGLWAPDQLTCDGPS